MTHSQAATTSGSRTLTGTLSGLNKDDGAWIVTLEKEVPPPGSKFKVKQSFLARCGFPGAIEGDMIIFEIPCEDSTEITRVVNVVGRAKSSA